MTLAGCIGRVASKEAKASSCCQPSSSPGVLLAVLEPKHAFFARSAKGACLLSDRGPKETLLRETREELGKADAKASILLAASGIAVAALLASGNDADWYPENLYSLWARRLAWAALAVTLLGVGFVGSAVRPRLRRQDSLANNAVHCFDDVRHFVPRWWHVRSRASRARDGRSRFVAALHALAEDDKYEGRLNDQIWQLSMLARTKYRLVSLGMSCYVGAAVLALVAFLIEKGWL